MKVAEKVSGHANRRRYIHAPSRSEAESIFPGMEATECKGG